MTHSKVPPMSIIHRLPADCHALLCQFLYRRPANLVIHYGNADDPYESYADIIVWATPCRLSVFRIVPKCRHRCDIEYTAAEYITPNMPPDLWQLSVKENFAEHFSDDFVETFFTARDAIDFSAETIATPFRQLMDSLRDQPDAEPTIIQFDEENKPLEFQPDRDEHDGDTSYDEAFDDAMYAECCFRDSQLSVAAARFMTKSIGDAQPKRQPTKRERRATKRADRQFARNLWRFIHE